MTLEDRLIDPPPAPSTKRKVRLHLVQWLGVPLLLFLPAFLGIAGLLGVTLESAVVRSGTLEAAVEWPQRFRYKQLEHLTIRGTNISSTALDSVTVQVSPDYASRFSTVVAIPAFDEPYVVTVKDVAPGAGFRVVVQLQAEHYGRHSGTVTIASPADTATFQLRTTVFP